MKRNFQFEKRKKDLDKKQKREDKMRKKLERRNQAGETGDLPPGEGTEPGASPPADDPVGG